MSLFDDYNKHIPEYYDWMYLDGFTPDEVMIAFHKKMQREESERQAKLQAEQDMFKNVTIKSEVKIKR